MKQNTVIQLKKPGSEPEDPLTQLLRSGARTLFHEWYHEGKLRSKISMEVGRSYNWRTWSYIEVRPNIVGNWEVFVSDSLGVNYDSLSFQIKATTIEQE